MLDVLSFSIEILWVDHTVWLESLWPWIIIKMVIATKSLVTLYSLFEFELNFREVRTELQGDFIDKLRGQGKVRPSGEVFVFLMLQFVLTTLKEIIEFLSDLLGRGLIPYVVQHLFQNIIGHQSERLRGGWALDRTDQFIPELVLKAGLSRKDSFWPDIEDAVVTLI